MTPPVIHRVTALDLRVRPTPWPFAQARRADIDAHFADRQREKPKLWNGRVLLARNAVFTEGRFNADYFETDFASFLAWRDWGFPDSEVFNGFGMGALRSADGAFVLGEMGQHTANAGRIYFPSGTPDLDDIRDGAVDIAGSVAREVLEETGLSEADYTAEPALGLRGLGGCDRDDPDIARRYAGRGAARADRWPISPGSISRNFPRSIWCAETRDLTSAMPRFVTAFIEREFSAVIVIFAVIAGERERRRQSSFVCASMDCFAGARKDEVSWRSSRRAMYRLDHTRQPEPAIS